MNGKNLEPPFLLQTTLVGLICCSISETNKTVGVLKEERWAHNSQNHVYDILYGFYNWLTAGFKCYKVFTLGTIATLCSNNLISSIKAFESKQQQIVWVLVPNKWDYLYWILCEKQVNIQHLKKQTHWWHFMHMQHKQCPHRVTKLLLSGSLIPELDWSHAHVSPLSPLCLTQILTPSQIQRKQKLAAHQRHFPVT